MSDNTAAKIVVMAYDRAIEDVLRYHPTPEAYLRWHTKHLLPIIVEVYLDKPPSLNDDAPAVAE